MPSFWRCAQCGKRCAWKMTINRHIAIGCNKERKYLCENCGKQFKHKHNLQAHLKVKHDYFPIDESFLTQVQTFEEPTFSAPPVQQKATRASSTASKDQLFLCGECGKSYTWMDNLRRHQRLHCGVIRAKPTSSLLTREQKLAGISRIQRSSSLGNNAGPSSEDNSMLFELINLTSDERQFLNESDKQIPKIDDDVCKASNKSNLPSEDNVPESIVQEYFKKIVRLFSIIHLNLQNIDKKLDNPERVQASTTTNDYTILSHFIPVNNIESINHFEMLITTDNDAVAQFRKMLNQTGGRSVKDCIYRSLRKMFTNSCAIQCSWQGRKNNFKVSNLSFMRIMKETFCTTFPHITEAEFEAIAAEWFRFAKQRLTREETRMMNRSDSLQSDQN